MKPILKSIFIAVIAVALAPLALAQDKEPGHIAFHYAITPKDGQMDAFRKAIETHMRWREQNGETWSWQSYDVIAGRGMNQVHFRSWGHHWGDMDAYNNSDFAKKADEHFAKTVEPYVASAHMFIDEDDPDLNAWPEEGYHPLLHLIGYHLKPGMTRQWYDAAKAIHAALQEGGFKEGYGFSWTVAGGPDPYVTLVLPHSNWKGFTDPDPSAYKVVSDQLGEDKAKELFHNYGSAIASAETWIVRHNQTLSTKMTQ